MREKLIRFFKQETVLCAALALAAVSMLLVPPDGEYISYVDFRTLATESFPSRLSFAPRIFSRTA